jgi:GTP-binding protein YchF
MGIVGLPNVGKSTLFNALTKSRGADAANYPFCTIEPNSGIVEVPDKRLEALAAIVGPEKIIPTTVEFVDIAGLVEGASKGEGLGNKFLAAISEADAICHVIRWFADDDITHVSESVDPARDRETIELELILSDIDRLEKHYEKVVRAAKTGDKDKMKEQVVCEKVLSALKDQKMAKSVELTDDETLIAATFQLLTNKPMVYAINVSEDELGTVTPELAAAKLNLDGHTLIVCAKLEAELIDMSTEDAAELLQSMEIEGAGLDNLIRTAYTILGYETYFTAGVKEVRAWTIKKGWNAPKAAGVIHTDFEAGFIRAEVIGYDDYIAGNGEKGAKENGKMRMEGKEYIVKDGDVMHIHAN